jgi:hypothetical protein
MELRATGSAQSASPRYPDGSDSLGGYLQHEASENASLLAMLAIGVFLNLLGRRWRKQEQIARQRRRELL